MAADQADRAIRRRVFYIPGYDPFHPRRYRELYRKESAEQAEISGYSLTLKPRAKGQVYGWSVAAEIEGRSVETEVEVLVWSDLVLASMSNSIPATYLQLARTAWTYIGSGALWRLMRLRKGPVIAALYPVGMLALQLAMAILLAWGAYVGVSWAGVALGALALMAKALAGALAAALFVVVLRWFRERDNKLFAYYLMHDYAYGAQFNGANPPELEARLAQFADRIAAAMGHDVDEVLVVGHSSGAHLAVSVLADLIRAGRINIGPNRPALSFLSLGQVVPMVSFLPRAQRLRADLAYLSARDELTWVDVTAPGDGCAFALCDPVAVTGVGGPDQKWPLVFSAAFTQTLSPARWKTLRWRFFRLHFQYLCAFDAPRDYDYFRITAGPMTLAARYGDRAHSPSRITAPVNRYRDMAS